MKQNKAASARRQNQAERLALFMWSNPGATEVEKAESIGVSRTTLWRYWKDEKFCKAVLAASDALTANARPFVDAALVRKAMGGDVAAIRLYYQLRGELSDKPDEMRAGSVDVTVTIKRAQLGNDEG